MCRFFAIKNKCTNICDTNNRNAKRFFAIKNKCTNICDTNNRNAKRFDAKMLQK